MDMRGERGGPMSWLEEAGRTVLATLLRPEGWRDPEAVPVGTVLHVGRVDEELAALRRAASRRLTPMPCGHPESARRSAEGGESGEIVSTWCGECEDAADTDRNRRDH